MKDTAYTQVNPLVRIAETKLISRDQFERMLAADSFAEVVAILKTTQYAPYLEGEVATLPFEEMLKQEQSQTFAWAYELSPERHLIDLYTLRYTYHNLKLLTKAKLSHQDLDRYFIDEGRFSLQKLKAAIATQQAEEMPLYMLEAIREVSAYYEEQADFQAVDIIYDRYYLNHLRQSAEKLGYPDILADMLCYIDLTNISTMIRGLIQNRSVAFMTTVLSRSGTISKKDLLPFCERPLSEFTGFLLNGPYKIPTEAALNASQNEVDSILFDRIKDSTLGHLFERSHFQAFGPLPLLSFLDAKETEINNLRLIFVGKKNHFAPDKIKERMRLGYGS